MSKNNITFSEIKHRFKSNDREREWIKTLMNTLQDISVDDPASLKILQWSVKYNKLHPHLCIMRYILD